MKFEARITGLGGQGAITAGHIFGSAAALHEGKEAVVTEGYSPYVTGGWSRADIVVSDEPIDYPLVSKLDALVTMYQEGLDLNLKMVKPGGVVVTEEKLVDLSKVVGDRRVFPIPAGEAAENLGKKMVMNIVMLGAMAALASPQSFESLKAAVAERFPRAAELNVKALSVGAELANKAKGRSIESLV
ncbi:MAG: 2-oxoacid:acceptor oxidoreductase family protein [Nitrososphaerota archaeon]|nr:2-oxoacid:acceptor oxidoreductase family protein [Nitrososphaerota archaeon]